MGWVRARPGQAVLLGVAALCVLMGPLAALVAPGQVVDVWMWPAGVLATVTGTATIARLRAAPIAATPQFAMALAVTVWGVSAMLTGFGHAIGSPAFVAGAEVAQVVALPVAYLALSVLPRATRLLSVAARVTLDAAALGIAMAVVAMPLLSPGAADPAAARVLTTLVPAALVTLFGAALAVLRRPPRDLAMMIWGLVIFASGALWVATFRATSLPRSGLWPAELLVVAGTAVTCAGLLALTRPQVGTPRATPTAALRGEGRDLVLHALVTTVAMGLLVLSVAIYTVRGDPVPPQTLMFVAAGIATLAVREILVTAVRRQLVRRVIEGSHTDPLTGLLNRVGMTDRLDADPTADGSLVVLDIDQFSHVNDQLGHSGADRVLIRVARAMRALPLPEGSVLARSGGDEFAVWLPGVVDPRAVAEELLATAAGATERSMGDGSSLTASAGVATTGEVGHRGAATGAVVARADMLLQRANAALIEAKSRGRASVTVFDARLADAHRRRQLIELRLAMALQAPPSDSDLTIHLQPVVHLVTGRVEGAEALARWHDPELGWVTPGEFIPIAEQTGLIVALGQRVLQLSVTAIASLADSRPDLMIAVNVSAAQLRASPDGVSFTEGVRRCLEQASVSPERLILEVTENLLICEDDPAVDELRHLMAMGIGVAVDDFGTGYWSLGYLQWLPASILKIDRSLVVQLGARRSAAVVRAIVDLATNLRMAVVVEGVETAQIARAAAELGAGLAQGWHYAAAVPAGDLLETIERIEAVVTPRPAGEGAAVPAQRAGTPHRAVPVQPAPLQPAPLQPVALPPAASRPGPPPGVPAEGGPGGA